MERSLPDASSKTVVRSTKAAHILTGFASLPPVVGNVDWDLGQVLQRGEKPHYLLHRPHAPVSARHRGLPERARRNRWCSMAFRSAA